MAGEFESDEILGEVLAIGAEFEIVEFGLAVPPTSPANGDTHVVGRGATGAWLNWDDGLAIWSTTGGWRRKLSVASTRGGIRVVKSSTGQRWVHVGGTWKVDARLGISKTGLVASTTQTQGEGPLAHKINHISAVANANDARTLPAARAGETCLVVNDGANVVQIFPASGHSIDALSVDASVTVAAGKRTEFFGVSDSAWKSLKGA